MSEIEEVLGGTSKKQPRVVHTFNVPESLHKHGITSLGIHELTPRDEQIAAKRSGGDSNRLAYGLALQALAEVNGKPVSTGDGTAEAAVNGMHPKIRNLMLMAYAEIHNTDEEATKDFLASRQVRV